MSQIKLVSYLSYRSLFPTIDKDGIILPGSYLDAEGNIDSLISGLLGRLDSISVIKHSSFINAIAQTAGVNELERIGLNDMHAIGLTDCQCGILYHRDNLLYIISKAIESETGTGKLVNQILPTNSQDYCKSLLLANELIRKPSIEKDIFIRSYPYYYIPEITEIIYQLRIQRYWHVYGVLMSNIDSQKIFSLNDGIAQLEGDFNISLKEYFHVIIKLFNRFILLPNQRKKEHQMGLSCFNRESQNSFYIDKRNFEDDEMLKLLERLAITQESFRQKFLDNRGRDRLIDGFYANFQTFFDYPILKIDDENFCIIDLKFLFEGICSGLVWQTKDANANIQTLKAQYGIVMEQYFIELLGKMFGESLTQTIEGPDAILQTDRFILVFEFTTEYYAFASLYNENLDTLKNDIYKILFNKGPKDSSRTKKKDKGKFLKLNGYLDDYKNSHKTVIPILVTENYLGDYDLINRFDNCIANEINTNNSLINIKSHKPVILNLDDLELFWQTINPECAIDQFGECIMNRENTHKGSYYFNFGSFCTQTQKCAKVNDDFKDFFNFQSFVKSFL